MSSSLNTGYVEEFYTNVWTMDTNTVAFALRTTVVNKRSSMALNCYRLFNVAEKKKTFTEVFLTG